MSGRVIVLASGKGGVGKSTLALALADVWAEAGHRVAVVDFDPQAGVTRSAGVAPASDPLEAPPVDGHGFTLWPSGRSLALASAEELTARLQAARASSGVVVVDLSPSLTDAAHVSAFAVADVVAVIARCDAQGLPNVAETVQLATSEGRRWLVVPTFKGTTGLAREAEAFLRGRYAEGVTTATVPTDAKAAEAPGKAKPVTQTARRSRVAEAVRHLAAELLTGAEQ